MRLSFTILLFYWGFIITKAQVVNLVPNGDFEINSALPTNADQVNLCLGWNNVNGIYYPSLIWAGSPDYFDTVSNNATLSLFGGIIPYSGNCQIGIITYINYELWREYISTQLSTKMIPGLKYRISFYLSNGLNPLYLNCSNNLGVNFSINPLFQNFFDPVQIVPQIEITSIISAWGYWKHFIFNYIATDTFNIITIGNFRNDLQTLISSAPNSSAGAYYFIDKIEIYPLLKLTGDSIICKGSSSTIKVIAGEKIVKWADSLSPNTIIATDSTITVTPLTTTTYFAYSSIDTASFTVHIINQPLINLGNDTTLCQGQTILLNTTKPNCTYLWKDSTTNATYNVSQQGVYWVKVSNQYNCYSNDTINITYNPLPLINLGNDTTLCPGQTLLLYATAANSTFLWQDNSINPTYNISQQGMYWVIITTKNCSNSDTINVYYSPPLNLFLGGDTSLCYGSIIKLDASNSNSTYHWQDNSNNSTYIVNQKGSYWVTVIDINNCSVSDTIKIIYQDCYTPDIYIPNCFTPNGDGLNDEFKIETLAEFNEFKMYIYNRWGELIFESGDINKGWNGTFKGKIVPNGVYVYLVTGTIKDTNEQIKRNGTITVLR